MWELIVIGGEVLAIIGLVILLIVLLSANKKKRVIREHMADRSRDDRLRIALENQYATDKVKDTAARNVAYQVSYHDDFEKQSDAICVQLTERCPLSTKEYMFYIKDLIRIGTDFQNELILKDDKGRLLEVQLIREDKQLFVKNCILASRVYLQRDKKQYPVDTRLIKVLDSDYLILGSTSIEIHILKF